MTRQATKVVTVTNATGVMSEATEGVHQECLYSVVDVANDSTTVYNSPCILYGVYVNTVLSAHACPIQDNTTAVITLPASLAAGTNLLFPYGIRMETKLIVDPNDAATGNITIAYKPL